MKISITVLLTSLAVVLAATQGGVYEKIPPEGKTPPGCSVSYSGQFEVTTVDLTVAKRDVTLKKRTGCGADGHLMASLEDGVLTDAQERTGYIAANYQLQFDGPPQAGAIITAGFSVCDNGTLALGDTTVFWACLSGTFSNLYDRKWAEHCSPVSIVVLPCGDVESAPQQPVGNVVGTTMVLTTLVTVLADGQPQVVTTEIPVPLCQIGDGQVQVHETPCAEVPVGNPVTQIGDGQIQAPTGKPVSQISDGQIQVPPGGIPAPTGQAPPAGAGEPQPSGESQAPTTPATTGNSPPATSSNPPTGGSAKTSASGGPIAALLIGIIAILVV